MENLHAQLLTEIKSYSEQSLRNQWEFLEAYKEAQQERNNLFRSIFNVSEQQDQQ